MTGSPTSVATANGMCLIVFAWQRHPRYRLILAGNRDEAHRRPAEPMHWWPDAPQLLAGRDLQAGGTWLAIGRNGRFATVTNYREAVHAKPRPKSRGELVTAFVNGRETPAAFSAGIAADRYAGFSLLSSDGERFHYTSNRDHDDRDLDPGIHGLSNATLDTPWPKLKRCRAGLERLVDDDRATPTTLFELLGDTRPAPVAEIDDGELPFEMARAVSAPFIRTEGYGTRCTTALLVDYDGNALVAERRFDERGRKSGESEFRFTVPDLRRRP